MNQSQHRRAWPRARWVVALLFFGLYVGGLRDHVLIRAGDRDYIAAQFGPGGLVYFDHCPWPLRVLWTINIGAGLLAPILVPVRARWAFVVASIAALAQGVLMTITFATRDRWQRLGAAASWFDLGVELVTVAFALWCWWLARRDRVIDDARPARRPLLV